MKIKVKQEVIARAKRCSTIDCPVAYSMIAVGFEGVVINRHWLSAIGLKNFHMPTPPKVARFIVDFDHGRPVEPFEFVIPEGNLTEHFRDYLLTITA